MIGICLASSAVSAEVVHVVKEPTGKAVQVAIDACAAQGGGVVCLPPGRYVSGPLWLKDRIELRLEAGATVVLSHDRKDWPAGVRALVNAKGVTNIAITGRGTFDGDARWEYAPVRGQDPEILEEQENARRAGLEMKRFFQGIEGLTLRDVVVDWDRGVPEVQWRSALVLRDISNLVLENFRGQAARPDGPHPAVMETNVTSFLTATRGP